MRSDFNRAQQQQQLPSCCEVGRGGCRDHAGLRCVAARHLLPTHPRTEPLRRKKTPHPCLDSLFYAVICRRAKARQRGQRYLSALGRSAPDARTYGDGGGAERGRTSRDGRRLGEKGRGPPAPQPQDAPRPAPHGPSPAWRSPLGAPRPIRAAAAPSSAAAAPPLLHTRGQRRGFGPAHLEAAGGKEEGERAEERAFSCRRAAGSAAS